MQDYIQWRTDFINQGLDNFSPKTQCRHKFYVKMHKKNVPVAYRFATAKEYLLAKEKGLITKEEMNLNK
jgi:hypothetical protein